MIILINIKKGNLKYLLISVPIAGLFVILIINGKYSAEGISNGLSLCAQTIIPSMFPFLVLSTFIIKSGLLNFSGLKLKNFFNKTFHLSGLSGGILFMGLFSGFPVGSSMALSLYNDGQISRNEAWRLILSTVNAGPAFVIGAVGTLMLSNTKQGIILYVSLSLSSVIIAYLSRFIFPDDTIEKQSQISQENFSDAFVFSVRDASASIISISSWIILFSCFSNIIFHFIENDNLLHFLKYLFEVSAGCEEASRTDSLTVLCAVIGWGGLCVHCQILPCIIKTKLNLKLFIASRILNGIISAIICNLLLKIFPGVSPVFSNITNPAIKTFSYSAPATAGLLLMCTVFILELDTKKKM